MTVPGRRLVSKKAVGLAVAAGLALSAAAFGLAGASFSGGGSGSGSGSTGFPTTFTVSSPIFVGGPLYPGTGADTIYATIQNATGNPLALDQLGVAIVGVTMNPPGSLYAAGGNPACTVADYALSAPTTGPGSFWLGLTVNGATKTGQSATWTQNLPQNIGVDDYVDAGLPGGGGATQGLPGGLTLIMLNTAANQDACQGATVQVAVSTNGSGSSGSGSSGGGGSGGGGSGGGGSGGGSGAASFVVAKSATPSGVYVGSSTPITYTLTASNNGGAPGGVTISDTAPAGTTLVSGSNKCPTVPAPSTCSTWVTGSSAYWNMTNVASGASVAVTFQVTANSGDPTGTVSNTALWSGPGCAAAVTCPTNTTTTTVTAPTPLLITASLTTSTYGAVAPTVTPVYSPAIGTPLMSPPTCVSTITASTAVGTYAGANTCAGASDPAYTITYAPGTGIVSPAPLTVTASSGSFPQGGTPPAITAGYSGFQNGESASSLTTQPTCSTTATSSTAAGTYPTTCSGALDPNYTITYVPGSVTARPPVTTPAPDTGVPATPAAPTIPPASSTPPAATTPLPSTTPQIAFTGAFLSEEWLTGMAVLLLGSGLVVIARWRRRTPRHAAK